MRRLVVLLVAIAVGLLGSGTGCTALISFDDQPALLCDQVVCDDGWPVDSPADARSDAADTGDAAGSGDGGEEGDAGLCDGRQEGDPCGANDACHDVPTCIAGVCTKHPKPDNTPCAAATNACHSVPLCKSGACGPSNPFPDGAQWEAGNDSKRCCSGVPVTTTTTSNCGVCGVSCKAGQSCSAVNGHFFCLPCSTAGDCWTGCCSLTTTAHCAPSVCTSGACNGSICPNGSHCQADVVNYCSY